MAVTPSLGLYWIWPGDPRVSPGVAAPYGQILFRLDNATVYWKSGPAATDWTGIGYGSTKDTFASGGFFGNGTDGDKVVIGDETLDRDYFWRDLTVPAGTTLFANGYRIFVSRLAVVDGLVHNNGADALGPQNQGGAFGNINGTVDGGAYGGGGQGFAGGAQGGGNVNQIPVFYLPVTQAPTALNYSINNHIGGNGGVGSGYGMGGGGGGANGGGAGGGPAISSTGPSGGDPRLFPQNFTLRLAASGLPQFSAGTGGGGGGRGTSGGGGTYGAGAGAGGGNLVFAAREFTGTGTISTRGGHGNHGANCNDGVWKAGVGAGGGGGGGFLSLITGARGGNVTLSSAGGLGGIGTGPDDTWDYTGGNGGDGTAGYISDYNMNQ